MKNNFKIIINYLSMCVLIFSTTCFANNRKNRCNKALEKRESHAEIQEELSQTTLNNPNTAQLVGLSQRLADSGSLISFDANLYDKDMPTVVIVDAYSSGQFLAEKLRMRRINVIHIFSTRETLPKYGNSFNSRNFFFLNLFRNYN